MFGRSPQKYVFENDVFDIRMPHSGSRGPLFFVGIQKGRSPFGSRRRNTSEKFLVDKKKSGMSRTFIFHGEQGKRGSVPLFFGVFSAFATVTTNTIQIHPVRSQDKAICRGQFFLQAFYVVVDEFLIFAAHGTDQVVVVGVV